ncbi:MAG: NAD-dependent epimerase/dehydratase family protein [Candidatus Omnitrophota bacterium]
MFELFRGKTVLVAGGAGFIGTNVIKKLIEIGDARIRATIHKKKPLFRDSSIDYVKCDLTEKAACQKVVQGVDIIFLCAASTSGAAVIAKTPLVHVTPNVVMNSLLLEAAYNAKVKKFVWLSSNAAYPDTGARPVKEDEMFDGDPYECYYAVGWMKRYTEILCKMYSMKLKDPMPCIVVRPSNIYGPFDDYDFATSHVMAAMIRKVAQRHDPIQMWGTGDDVRDMIYVDDFVDALFLATEKIDTFDPVNVGLGAGFSLKEILKTILEADGYGGARVVYDPTKPSMIPIRLLDTSKAEKVLGFKARTGIREGAIKTIEWYRQTYGSRGTV